MEERRRSRLRDVLAFIAYAYLVALLTVTALAWWIGDRSAWCFALNALRPYWFLPWPAALLIAALTRQTKLLVLAALAGTPFLYSYGGRFVPLRGRPTAGAPTFSVMSANLLGFSTDSSAVIESLRASGADVIALQELNPAHAAVIDRELSSIYRWRVLDPQPGVSGSGVIAKVPLRATEEVLAGKWVGRPHVLVFDVGGREVKLVRFHSFAGVHARAAREAQARVLAEFARRQRGPLVVLGDLNATDQNLAHALITAELRDAWLEAGWGFGHTFPGAAETPGSSRPTLLGVPVPKWLVRIDYVFHSSELVATHARVGPWDGASDHRPVLAELAFAR